MKTITPLKTGLFALLALSIINGQWSIAQVSTNKAFFLGTNNCLPPNETNFFAVNSNLLNASVASAGGGGGGFTGNPSQFASAGGTSNIISGVALTNINAQGLSNSAWQVVAGSQTNSNTFRIYQGNFGDLMDWYGTGGSAAYMDHLANFTTLGNVVAAEFRDNQGFSTDGLGDVLAKVGTLSSNLYIAQTNFANYEVISNNLAASNITANASMTAATNITAGGAFIGLDTGLTNLAGQTILAAQTASNQAQGAAITNYALANFVHGQNGHGTNTQLQTPTTTNLTETATLSVSNLLAPDGNFFSLDGGFEAGDNMLLTNVVIGQGILLDGYGDIDFFPANNTGGHGNYGSVLINPPTPGSPPAITAPGFVYWQNNNSSFMLYGAADANNGSLQEVADLEPVDYAHANNSDRLVVTANSNNMDIRLQGDATLSAGGLWQLSTNISGKSAFTMNMYCTRVLCNPAAASCTITAPSSDNVGYVLPTASQPFRGWGAQNATVAGGHGLGPVWMTLQYEIENLGSNTANTLTVALPNNATNWGLSSLVIPNQMGLRMHYGGTNNVNAGFITAELYALSLSPTFNGQNLTNLNAANLTGAVAGTNLPNPLTNQISTGAATISGNASGLTNLNPASLAGPSNGYVWVSPTHGWYHTNFYATNLNGAKAYAWTNYSPGTNFIWAQCVVTAYCPTNLAKANYGRQLATVWVNNAFGSDPVSMANPDGNSGYPTVSPGGTPSYYFSSPDTTNYWKIEATIELNINP
jgi:hypothetical protein